MNILAHGFISKAGKWMRKKNHHMMYETCYRADNGGFGWEKTIVDVISIKLGTIHKTNRERSSYLIALNKASSHASIDARSS